MNMRIVRMFNGIRTIPLLLLLVLSTSGTASATVYEELFLQPDMFEESYSDTSYMDLIQPIGSKVKSGVSRDFVTRPLAGSSTFTRFDLKLWVSASTRDHNVTVTIGVRLHNASSSFVPIVMKYGSQLCKWTGCQVTVPADAQTVEATFYVGGSGFTTFAGKRLEIQLSSPRTFYWGDSAHPSSLTTDHAEYGGVPIPEFTVAPILLMIALLGTVTLLRPRRTRANKAHRA